MSTVAEYRRGLLLAVAGVLILTPDTLLIRLVDTDPLTMSGLRGLLSAFTLLAFFSWRDRRLPTARILGLGRAGLVVSALFAANSLLFVYSVANTYVANSLLYISAAPLIAALGSRLFLGEHIPRRTWISIGVVLMAMLLLFGDSLGSGRSLGDLAALGTGAMLAATFVIARHVGHLNMTPCVAVGGLIVVVLTAPFAEPLALDAYQWSLVLVLGLVILPASFSLLMLAPRWVPAAEVSLIMLLEAVLGPFWVWLVIEETPSWQTLVGGSIILATLSLHAIGTKKAW